ACRNIASENNIYIEGGKFDLYTTGGLINEGDVINESSASCIKADNGIFVSGTPEFILYSESVKGTGMNADSTIVINGGKIDCTIFGTGAKGLNCGYEFGGEIVIDGANTIVKVNIFGGGLHENDVDDSKASGIKSDGNVEIKNGKVTIDAANETESTTFEALRGISANNNVTISGGYTKITLDDATAKTYAIKADGKVYLKKGCLEYSCPDSEVAENVKVKPSPIFIEE
ncbi:MAG: carbohydrate-binding domain-containing protein, partial [Paludibacteraceae bacterium]|nr:carbohydrate-binding domain-containing protein [Paludibacteraceae bacterium]